MMQVYDKAVGCAVRDLRGAVVFDSRWSNDWRVEYRPVRTTGAIRDEKASVYYEFVIAIPSKFGEPGK